MCHAEQNVDQTTTVYGVGDARATLTHRIDAYAAVTGEGFEGSATRVGAAGPSVPELLAKDPTLGPSTKKILAIISGCEGRHLGPAVRNRPDRGDHQGYRRRPRGGDAERAERRGG